VKKYMIEIRTPNRMFSVRGVLVRTPAKWIVNETEVNNIKLKITSEGIEKFSIEEYDPTKIEQPKPKKEVTVDTITDLEEEIKEPTTTLEKLMVK